MKGGVFGAVQLHSLTQDGTGVRLPGQALVRNAQLLGAEDALNQWLTTRGHSDRPDEARLYGQGNSRKRNSHATGLLSSCTAITRSLDRTLAVLMTLGYEIKQDLQISRHQQTCCCKAESPRAQRTQHVIGLMHGTIYQKFLLGRLLVK